MIRLFVPYIGPSTNVAIRQHWRKHKDQVELCDVLTKQAVIDASLAPISHQVDLYFTPRLGPKERIRDTGNYSISCKTIEDGLVRAGLLPDDRGEYVREWKVRPPIIDRKQESGTWVEIIRVEEEAA
ncbi:RusA family crossover junction endodeoxyribonuclease [Halomonas sp. WWR20]